MLITKDQKQEACELAYSELYKRLDSLQLYVLKRWFKHHENLEENFEYYDSLELKNPEAFKAHEDEEYELDILAETIFCHSFGEYAEGAFDKQHMVVEDTAFFTRFLRSLLCGQASGD
jgi:hypothetical protein